ncbi:MAG: GNAT family N-acetyltransferase, partial [Gammaproteobacteria bacterium]
ALIKAVTDEAKKQNWAEVYWHTKEHNSVARGLYDNITGGTDGFIVYRVEFDQ